MEFESAMLGKNASELGRELDKLYDQQIEKQANWWDKLKGAYLTYALGSAGAAGTMGYSVAKSRQRRALFEAAQKKRLAAMNSSRPAEIYAIPTRVPSGVPTRQPDPPEEEEDNEETDAYTLPMYSSF